MSNGDHDGAADPLRDAIETLEAVVRDRGLLRELSLEERTRLLAAAGNIFNPDIGERRRSVLSSPRGGRTSLAFGPWPHWVMRQGLIAAAGVGALAGISATASRRATIAPRPLPPPRSCRLRAVRLRRSRDHRPLAGAPQ